jgi:hypothetical protein
MRSSDVDRLLGEYVFEHRGGGDADPRHYLEQLQGADRAELAALIDGFLARQPRRSFDAAVFRGSAAEALVESLDTSLRGQAGLWPALLPRLRDDAQLKRSDVVARLAEALGAPDELEKVAGYYHQMEQGLLPPAGVSDVVLDALARIVNVSAAALRRAGEAIAPTGADRFAESVFARATPAPEAERTAASHAPADEMIRDAIDRLFLGDG